MRINNNIMAVNTTRQLVMNRDLGTKSMQKLSSGYRINSASDDAAGLAISEKMRNQIKGLNQASRNAQDGISLMQTAEGGLAQTHAILLRMRELSVKASTDTLQDADRTQIKSEFDALMDETDKVATLTKFNNMNLLDATGGSDSDGNFTFHVGANKDETLVLTINDMQTSGVLAMDGAVVDTVSDANDAIETLDTAIGFVSTERANLGANINKLEYKIKNLDSAAENTTAAESRIRDVDMAQEMVEFTKNDILQQAAQAMLAKANQAPQAVLQLLR